MRRPPRREEEPGPPLALWLGRRVRGDLAPPAALRVQSQAGPRGLGDGGRGPRPPPRFPAGDGEQSWAGQVRGEGAGK